MFQLAIFTCRRSGLLEKSTGKFATSAGTIFTEEVDEWTLLVTILSRVRMGFAAQALT